MPEVPTSGLPSPPSSPPLAAITASGQLALTSNRRGRHHRRSGQQQQQRRNDTNGATRRGGAALLIREECERFFCEALAAAFHGEGNAAGRASGLSTGVSSFYNIGNDGNGGGSYRAVNGTATAFATNNNNSSSSNSNAMAMDFDMAMSTPPDDDGGDAMGLGLGGGVHPRRRPPMLHDDSFVDSGVDVSEDDGGRSTAGPDYWCNDETGAEVAAWLEVWDYAGGTSYRGFVAHDDADEATLFLFFTEELVARDLKQALIALIELAEAALGCTRFVFAVDRGLVDGNPDAEQAEALTKSLRWVGFEPTSLEPWTGDRRSTSRRWLFMGMEV